MKSAENRKSPGLSKIPDFLSTAILYHLLLFFYGIFYPHTLFIHIIIFNILLIKEYKKGDRIKDMLLNVATKDTYVTITTIRNRFIELT